MSLLSQPIPIPPTYTMPLKFDVKPQLAIIRMKDGADLCCNLYEGVGDTVKRQHLKLVFLNFRIL